MKMNRVDTEKTYQLLWEKITTLELPPGSHLDISELARNLAVSQRSVEDALELLVHDHLVLAPPRGLQVAGLAITDLDNISAVRLHLETLAAREAALKAEADQLTILRSLCEESPESTEDLFKLDQRFHQAVARASQNPYLEDTLQKLYGLSRRLWYLALPYLDFLPGAILSHLDLVAAIEEQNPDQAGNIMHHHIQEFYTKIRDIIQEKGLIG